MIPSRLSENGYYRRMWLLARDRAERAEAELAALRATIVAPRVYPSFDPPPPVEPHAFVTDRNWPVTPSGQICAHHTGPMRADFCRRPEHDECHL